MVSIILPTKDRLRLLERALRSVVRQTYENFEYLVVDDSSDAPESEVIDEIGDTRIRCIRHNLSRWASAARNSGICESSRKHFAFLNDDGEWLPAELE